MYVCYIYNGILGLPWKPKVRQKDIDMFLENARLKFVGYNLEGDRESLAGLPQPIHEGVKTLKEVCNLFRNLCGTICFYNKCILAHLCVFRRITDQKGGRNC